MSNWLDYLTEDVVKTKLAVVDAFVDEIVEPLSKIGNPEKLIGKPYEQWDETDMMLLAEIYGPQDKELSRFIFRKAYEEVKRLEDENART